MTGKIIIGVHTYMIRIYLSRVLGEKRMTQAELSRKTGIRPATINEIYHELTERINLEHLDRICEVLDCPLSDLMNYELNRIKKTGKDLIVEEHRRRKQSR